MNELLFYYKESRQFTYIRIFSYQFNSAEILKRCKFSSDAFTAENFFLGETANMFEEECAKLKRAVKGRRNPARG